MAPNLPKTTISKENYTMMLVMTVGMMRSNAHKHFGAISSSDIVTEAGKDIDEVLKRTNTEVVATEYEQNRM